MYDGKAQMLRGLGVLRSPERKLLLQVSVRQIGTFLREGSVSICFYCELEKNVTKNLF